MQFIYLFIQHTYEILSDTRDWDPKMNKKCPSSHSLEETNKPIKIKLEMSTWLGTVAIMECFLEVAVCEHL